jgi:hypothetical protein
MATYDTSSSTGTPFSLENRYFTRRITIGAAGETLVTVRAWLNESSTNNAHGVKAICFLASDGSFVAESTARTDIQTGAIAPYDFTFSVPPSLSNVDYDIGLFVGAGAGNLNWDGDNASGTSRFMIVATYPTITDPASWTTFTGILRMLVTTNDPGGGGPTITDVDEDNTITLEQANVEIDGTDFDDNVVEIRQDGFDYVPSVDSANATAIVFDMTAVGTTGPVTAPHAGSATVAVINVDLSEDTQAITISDRSGSNTLLIGTPNADPDLRLDSTADAVAGDYVMWFNVVGGAIGDVTVNDDLTFDVAEGVTSFDFQIWDSGDGTWGDAATQTIEVVDEVPDAFSFVDATNAPLTTVITSDAVVPTGYDTADISVTGGEYSINGGAFTASAGTVVAGDSIRARGTSSGSNSTTVNVAVTIGGVSDTFSITTLAASSGTSKYMTLLGVG